MKFALFLQSPLQRSGGRISVAFPTWPAPPPPILPRGYSFSPSENAWHAFMEQGGKAGPEMLQPPLGFFPPFHNQLQSVVVCLEFYFKSNSIK